MDKDNPKKIRKKNANGMGTYVNLPDGRKEWRQMVDGNMRSVSAPTAKELKGKVSQIANLPIIKEKYKVNEWFTKWLTVYVKPLKKTATYNQYNDIYRIHIEPVIGNYKLINIKSYDIQTVIAKINEKNLSTWTMKHAKKIMNIAFTQALKDKLITENPVHDIEIPKKQAKPRIVLKPEELGKIYEAMKNSRWIWSAKFMLVTGLRRGELLALRWSDIDFKNKRITIDESNSNTGLGDTKSSEIHYVPLSKLALKYLDAQKEMLQSEFNPILFNEELQKTDLIFPNQSGQMLRADSYYTLISRFAKKAGVKANPHCLRHTFVFMTRDTLSLKDIQYILGHDESTTTLDIYGDILNDNSSKTANAIDDVFTTINEEINNIKKNEKAKKGPKVITIGKF